ncbi:MAG: hypothetical protein IJX08_08960, partial [Clostridia bacterium]|nr:hypothetical protein [Clostridia bacterium]
MKPVFCIDVTENKDNETINGGEFVIKTVSKERSEKMEDALERAMDTEEKAKLPLPCQIIEWICGSAGLLIASVSIGACLEIGFTTAYQNAPYFFYIAGACLIVWLILFLLSKKREKEVLDDTTVRNTEQELDANSKAIYDELGVPSDAPNCDILTFTYKIKNGEIKVKNNGVVDYLNIDTRVYLQDGCLCISDLEEVHAFPLAELTGIQTVNKRISVPLWNKEEAHNKGEYKKYKMTQNDAGFVCFKPYHILTLMHEGEEHGIYFPCYELPLFE